MGDYLVREQYLSRIRAGRDDTAVIKVMTGMRRCGKSVILEQYADEIRRSGISDEDIIFINFENFEFQKIKISEQLNDYLSQRIDPGRRTYVFLDEIQDMRDWELSLSALNAEKNYDVYVTCTNIDVLSSQLANHISGRHIEIEVFPLAFSEYIEMYGRTDRDGAFIEYFECGGCPGPFHRGIRGTDRIICRGCTAPSSSKMS